MIQIWQQDISGLILCAANNSQTQKRLNGVQSFNASIPKCSNAQLLRILERTQVQRRSCLHCCNLCFVFTISTQEDRFKVYSIWEYKSLETRCRQTLIWTKEHVQKVVGKGGWRRIGDEVFWSSLTGNFCNLKCGLVQCSYKAFQIFFQI